MTRWMRRKLPSFTRYNESCEEAFSGPASALLLTRSSLEVLLRANNGFSSHGFPFFRDRTALMDGGLPGERVVRSPLPAC